MVRSKSANVATKQPSGDLDREQYARARKQADRRFHNALMALPESSTPAKELSWIKNHPKMIECDRSADPNHRVVLTCKDIKGAPSKHAAQALQHWVNRPNEFFKNMLTEDQKRRSEPDVEAQDDLPPEIRTIDEMLLTLEGAIPRDADSGIGSPRV